MVACGSEGQSVDAARFVDEEAAGVLAIGEELIDAITQKLR
jgi:hypothetical protein